MNLYNLPKNTIVLNENNLKLKFISTPIIPHINKSLYSYSQIVKNKINNLHNEWNYNKKYTNIYEFIHTNISSNNESISKLKPVSRAFYKLIEIINTTNILQPYENQNSIFKPEALLQKVLLCAYFFAYICLMEPLRFCFLKLYDFRLCVNNFITGLFSKIIYV